MATKANGNRNFRCIKSIVRSNPNEKFKESRSNQQITLNVMKITHNEGEKGVGTYKL